MQNGSAATNAIYNIEASNLHQHLYNLRSVAPITEGSFVATKLLLALKLPPVFAASKLYYRHCKAYSCSGCKHALTATPPWICLCHNSDTISNTRDWPVSQRSDTIIGNTRARPVSQHSDTISNTRARPVSQHSDTISNTRASAVSQHSDTISNARA